MYFVRNALEVKTRSTVLQSKHKQEWLRTYSLKTVPKILPQLNGCGHTVSGSDVKIYSSKSWRGVR